MVSSLLSLHSDSELAMVLRPRTGTRSRQYELTEGSRQNQDFLFVVYAPSVSRYFCLSGIEEMVFFSITREPKNDIHLLIIIAPLSWGFLSPPCFPAPVLFCDCPPMARQEYHPFLESEKKLRDI